MLAATGQILLSRRSDAALVGVSGAVVSPSGAPVQSALVEALFNGSVVASQGTDGAGRYGFASIPEGAVDLRVSVAGNGSVPPTPPTTTSITVAGNTAVPNITISPSTPLAYGTVTWNGTPYANGTTATFDGTSFSVAAGGDARVTTSPNTPIPGTSRGVTFGGNISIPVPSSADVLARSVTFTANSGDHKFYAVRYTPGSITSDTNTNVDFTTTDVPVILVNPNGTQGTGYLEVDNFFTSTPVATGGDYARFTGTVNNSATVRTLTSSTSVKYVVRTAQGGGVITFGTFVPTASGVTITLAFPTAPLSGFIRTPSGAPVSGALVEAMAGSTVLATRTTAGDGAYSFNSIPLGSRAVRVSIPATGTIPAVAPSTTPVTVSGPTTLNITITPNAPMAYGILSVNGVPAAHNAAVTVDGKSSITVAGADARYQASLGISVAGAVDLSTGNGAYSIQLPQLPTPVDIIRESVGFNAQAPSDHRLSFIRFTPETLAADTQLGWNVTTAPQVVQLVNPDGTPGTGYLEMDNYLAPVTAGGDFFRFTGTVAGNTTISTLTSATTARYTVRSAPGAAGEPLAVGTFSPGGSPLVINLRALVSGRVLINGVPTGSSITLAGTTWSVSGGINFRTGGVTDNALSLPLDTTTGDFSRRVPTGPYAISIGVNLIGTSGPGAGTSMYFQRYVPEALITGDVALGDINFVTVDQTIRVLGLPSGAPVNARVRATNIPSGGPNANGQYYFAESPAITGDFLFPALAGNGSVNVLDPATSAVRSSGTFNAGTLTTIVLGGLSNVIVGAGDSDGDGVSDAVEALSPIQDANGDGIADYTQNFVASPPIAGSTQRVSIISLAGRPLVNAGTLPLSFATTPPPPGAAFPIGFVKFSMAVPVGGTTTVRLRVTPAVTATLTGYAKYNSLTNVWSQLPNGRVNINRPAGFIDIAITDNGIGDEDPTPGIIRDPGAPLVGKIRKVCYNNKGKKVECKEKDDASDDGDD